MQEFKVGDHVIVDEGDYLDNGLDGVVVGTYPADVVSVEGSVIVEGWSTRLRRPAFRLYVDPSSLIKVDDLVTGPFAPGDRAIVVDNMAYYGGGITHFIEVGTDVEVVSGPHVASSATYYEVHGVHTDADVRISQSVALCDLEAEPTYPRRSAYSWYDGGETIEFSLTPVATYALTNRNARRAAALRDVVEMLGADTDGAKLVEVAEWLLSGKVPA